MNKRLRFLLICLLFFMLVTNASAEVNLPTLAKAIKPAVVTVITYDLNNKPLGQGTGFFINKRGHLITNYHVLKGAYTAEIKTFDGRKYPIKLVVAENKIMDLVKVLVDIPENAVNYVKVTKDLPASAERILVVGVVALGWSKRHEGPSPTNRNNK